MLRRALIVTWCCWVIPGSARATQASAGSRANRSRTIDQVVACVDGAAITQSDVETEYRIETFLEEGRAATVPDGETFSRVLERLIDQKLLMEEPGGAGTRESTAAHEAAQQTLGEVRKRLSSEAAFQAALRSLGVSESELLRKVEQQQRILRIVDQRMRPLVSVEQDEIDAYYHSTFLPEWAKKTREDAPPLAEVEDQIREILVQRKIDQQLDAWVKELRETHRVRRISSTYP